MFSIQKLLKKEKAFLLTAGVLLLIVGAILLSAASLVDAWYAGLAKNALSQANAAITRENNSLLTAVKSIADSQVLNRALVDNDTVGLIAALTQEQNNRGLGPMSVTDANGNVITRSVSLSKRGDNIFQTTAYGALVAQANGPVKWIDKAKYSPLAMGAGVKIVDNGKTLGALFAFNVFDDAYAQKFKKDFLDGNDEVVFYSNDAGITGSSFGDEAANSLLENYFNPATLGKNNTGSDQKITLNGQYYIVTKTDFPGIKQSQGGMLVFVPSPHGTYAIVFAAVITLLFLLISWIIQYLYRPRSPYRHTQILLFGSLLLFIITFLLTDHSLSSKFIMLKKSQQAIYNSTIAFNPEADIFDKNFETDIAIEISTGGEAINAARAVVNYDPTKVKILEISTVNSFCDPGLIVEKNIDAALGQATIACGLPSPGLIQPMAVLADLIVQPISEGQFSLKFGADTQVLANDGLGTNVLRLATDGSYQIISPANTTVYSETNPNSLRWYPNRSISFSWPAQAGVTYKYALNRDPNFTPSQGQPTNATSVNLSVGSDGIYYFHLLAQANGKTLAVSHFKVMVDSTPPDAPKILASSGSVNPGDIVRFDFQSHDALSGLQPNFYVKVNDGIFLPVKPPFYVPFTNKGTYTLTVRVFDNAGNFSDSTKQINVGE